MQITKNGTKSNGEEELKELKSNGEEKEEKEEAKNDLEKGTEENGGKAGKKTTKRNERQLLLGPEEIERYRKDPIWKALRFALFGSLVCLFLLLVVVAILIVALSSKCAGGGEIGTTIDLLAGNVPSKQLFVAVMEGESAFIHCDGAGGKIRWHRKGRNGEAIGEQNNNDIEQFDNGTLHIRNVKWEEMGEYICEGMAPLGREWHRLTSVKLEVAQNSKYQEDDRQQQSLAVPSPVPSATSAVQFVSLPRVDSHLKLAFAGEKVHFRCWMDGKSGEDLSWQKVTATDARRREEGAAGEGISLLATEPDGHSAFLLFGAVKESDAGEYKCVEGQSGASSALVRLRVEPSRSPIIEPIDQLVSEHSPAKIRCSVPGHPSAQLIWRRENGVEVGTIKGVTDDGKGTLRIAEVRREHERMGWVCWAVYSHMADKQALSAGPVVIRVLITDEEESVSEGEATENQREEEEEEGSGEEEESGREAEEGGKSAVEEEKGEQNSEGKTEQQREEKKADKEGGEEEKMDNGEEGGQDEKQSTDNDNDIFSL
ncbi:hypothetical protein niasHS_013269 [Heterodera schachtii]|uniref:Ig-like domain-containing protein n=1 Tax=Heterodera schachtii TaxID=97005 RepID=A0ABD2IJ54_HETSC